MKSLFALCKVIGVATIVGLASFASASANVLQPATNLTGTIDITLVAPGGIVGDPTPISTTPKSVPATDGTLISAGDGTEIGSWMLANEQISLSGDTFNLSIYAGASVADPNANQSITGYLGTNGNPAEYQFTGLTIPGQVITGLKVTSSYSDLVSTIDINSLVNLTDPSSFSVNLDRLIFNDIPDHGNSLDHIDLSVELLTSPVPEPMTSALLAGGLLMMLATRRFRRPLTRFVSMRSEVRHV